VKIECFYVYYFITHQFWTDKSIFIQQWTRHLNSEFYLLRMKITQCYTRPNKFHVKFDVKVTIVTFCRAGTQIRSNGRHSCTHVVPAKQNRAARFPMDSKAVDDKSRVKMLSVNSDRAEGERYIRWLGDYNPNLSITRVTSSFKWRRSILAPMSDQS